MQHLIHGLACGYDRAVVHLVPKPLLAGVEYRIFALGLYRAELCRSEFVSVRNYSCKNCFQPIYVFQIEYRWELFRSGWFHEIRVHIIARIGASFDFGPYRCHSRREMIGCASIFRRGWTATILLSVCMHLRRCVSIGAGIFIMFL